jgi:hypothetical protein
VSRQPNAWTPGHSTCINHGACGPTCPEYRVEDCAGCLDAIEDAPTRPDLPRLQPLAMRIGNALAACPEPEAEELWRALRALQRLSEKDRRDMIGYAIAKVAAAYAAQPPARDVRVEPTVPVNAHGTAVYQWVMLHVPPEPGTAVEVRLHSETATPQWEPDVFVSVDDVGDWEFASGSWYRPSDRDAFCITAVRVRA